MLYPHLQYKKTSHFLHLILTLLTGGFWIIIWAIIWATNSNHNSRVDLHMAGISRGARNPNERERW